MELKQGYKQTEVGVIPEDWETVKIEFIIKSTQLGGNYSNGEFENEHPLIKMGNLDRGKIKLDKIQYINSGKPSESDLLKFGDVLFNTRNTLDLVGKVAIWRDELSRAYFNSNIMRLNFNENIGSSFWMNLILNTPNFITQLRGIAIGTTSVAAIYNRDLFKLYIPLPPLPEQTAIANALSDMDALISQTEKLIEKKKAIKQGAMQELLKPKEGWVTKKFTDVVNYIHGKAHEQFIVENGKYQVVNSKFVSTEGTVKKYADVSFLTAKKGDVLTVLSDLPNGKALAKCFYVEEDNKYAVNQRICIWRSISDYPKFLFYFLNRHKYFMAINDGVSQTHILNGHIEKFFIEIPENYNEQQSIAETLWDIDKELKLIETKLTKLKQQKQGMMQALLTGKIRLVS